MTSIYVDTGRRTITQLHNAMQIMEAVVMQYILKKNGYHHAVWTFALHWSHASCRGHWVFIHPNVHASVMQRPTRPFQMGIYSMSSCNHQQAQLMWNRIRKGAACFPSWVGNGYIIACNEQTRVLRWGFLTLKPHIPLTLKFPNILMYLWPKKRWET